MFDVLIIGSGVIGASIARELSKYSLSVTILEKNNDVGSETSSANSAIIHSGYDPKPGTLKLKFNAIGNPMFNDLCKDLDVPFKRIGSLTVATSEEEADEIRKSYKQGLSYNIPLELVDKAHLKEYEPNISDDAILGLYAPTCGIIDPFNYVNHLVENAVDNGVKLFLNEEVNSITPVNNGEYFKIMTKNSAFESKIVLNCAGLFSNDIAKMVEPIDWDIIPRRGQYYVIDHAVKPFVNHTVFPAPSKIGKGILVSPTSAGDYILGPTSDEIEDKTDNSNNLPTAKAIRVGASKLIDNIPYRDQIRSFSGIRAHPTTDDFIIEPSKSYKNFINVAGIESPGLSSSPAIAEYVVNDLVGALIPLEKNHSFNPKVRPYIRTKYLSVEEINELIKTDPSYGEIICNCEKVTLGEVLDLYKRSVPINSVKAIKRRLGVGMGKCQGGFCTPKLVKALSEYLDIDMNEIIYDNLGSYILQKKVKDD